MHKKIPKICTGCRVSAAKIYLYHSTEIAKARPHSEEWQTDTSSGPWVNVLPISFYEWPPAQIYFPSIKRTRQ